MNRKEVIERYKSLLNYRYSHGMEYDASHDGVVKDATTDLIESVLRELTNANPDPITGLVPCGCGGKAELHPAGGVGNNDVMAECTTCSVAVICVTKEEAIRVWNEAMGYKEDEE